MSDEKALVQQNKADAPAEWGTRSEIGALAERLAVMLPNAQEMSRNEVMTAAQYCRVMDLNPFRGEVYFYKSRGRLVVVDGYKALARWAQRKAPYSDRFEQLPTTNGQLTAWRCWILRDDRKPAMREYLDMGATFREAYEMAATFADGVVMESELVTRGGQPNDPPVGWTWEQVARKRALKTALNLSHGAPSPREIADLSWRVNGTATTAEDWDGAEELSVYEAEKLAELRAKDREHRKVWESLDPQEQQEQLRQNTNLLRGDEEDPFAAADEPGTNRPQAEVKPLSVLLRETLEAVNAKTGGYYKHEQHLMHAVHLAVWPPVDDTEAWIDVERAAVVYAAKQQVPKPAPQPQTAANGAQVANIKSTNWKEGAVMLAATLPDFYANDKGDPNFYKMTRAAATMGYATITDANLAEVLEVLVAYAADQGDQDAKRILAAKGLPEWSDDAEADPSELDEYFDDSPQAQMEF